MNMDIQQTIEKISRGTVEIINIEGLARKLHVSQKTGKPLRIKAGFDPTASDIHLGHVVLLQKMKQFQELGHQVFFLIGDFTAQIGDPTGRDQMRPQLTLKEIKKNARTYEKQIYSLLDPKKTKVVFNSSWLGQLAPQEILELTTHSTVAQMLARADFKKRHEQNKEISILEFIYPLLQGYDSIYLKADIELGGSDQKFNLLMGRQLQEVYGQEPQVVIMTPLLEGTDGIQKMSKSSGNYIGINEPSDEIFGKLMSITDELMFKYFEFLTDFNLEEIKTLHPKEAKLQLAQKIVEKFYNKKEALKARDNFEKTFSRKQSPDRINEYRLGDVPSSVFEILKESGFVGSRREFQRLIDQGAVSYEGQKIDAQWVPQKGILKIGKRRFLKVV